MDAGIEADIAPLCHPCVSADFSPAADRHAIPDMGVMTHMGVLEHYHTIRYNCRDICAGIDGDKAGEAVIVADHHPPWLIIPMVAMLSGEAYNAVGAYVVTLAESYFRADHRCRVDVVVVCVAELL